MKYYIKDNQAGFVFKNGIFKKMIPAGTYHFSKMAGYQVEIEEMSGEVDILTVPYQVLAQDSLFQNSVIHIEIADGSIGFIYINGKLTTFANRREYTFWNVFDKYEVKVVSMKEVLMGAEVTKQMRSLIPGNLYTHVIVKEGEVGLVYYDHVLQHQLSRGEYCFWNYQYNITQNVLDLKQKELNIVGQEILTKDKISIRMNVACMYRIRDAVEFAATVSNLQAELYSAAQLAIREIVGNYKLDEILEIREQISQEIYEALQKKEHMFCVSFLTAGIKDIILPGEIREIMNSVLVAEKTAQANVIARREEVASTRSLLNTAKLMEENSTLFKLKELEYLERICDKVGDISVNGNAGMVEELGKLMGMSQAG